MNDVDFQQDVRCFHKPWVYMVCERCAVERVMNVNVFSRHHPTVYLHEYVVDYDGVFFVCWFDCQSTKGCDGRLELFQLYGMPVKGNLHGFLSGLSGSGDIIKKPEIWDDKNLPF